MRSAGIRVNLAYATRHYGFLSSRVKPKLRMEQMKLGIIPTKKEKTDWKVLTNEKLGYDVDKCLSCTIGRMIRIMSFEANASPFELMAQSTKKSLTKG